MYEGLTTAICQKAWNIVSVTADAAQEDGVTNKDAGTIVVCFPRTYPDAEFDMIFIADAAPNHPDREKYERIAVEKAKVSWETGLPSRKVQQDAPHLYRPGMTKWGGSVIENGLIVAFSGVQQVFDEAIAGTMLRWIVALCQDEMTRKGGVMDDNSSFIGEVSTPEVPLLHPGTGAATATSVITALQRAPRTSVMLSSLLVMFASVSVYLC